MKRIVTLFLSLILLLSCLCAPASAMFDPSLFYEVQAKSAYIVNTDTNIIVYDKDSSRQVSAGGLTKYMTIALLLTNYADQLDNTFQMPFAISDYVHNSDNADMRSNETFTYREAVYAMLLRNANEAAMGEPDEHPFPAHRHHRKHLDGRLRPRQRQCDYCRGYVPHPTVSDEL